jgi:hypothetical protein
MPQDYVCPQFSMMNIDENCNIIQCCGTPSSSKDYFVCNTKDFKEDIFLNRKNRDICKECYATKWVYWAHNTGNVSTKFIYISRITNERDSLKFGIIETTQKDS